MIEFEGESGELFISSQDSIKVRSKISHDLTNEGNVAGGIMRHPLQL